MDMHTRKFFDCSWVLSFLLDFPKTISQCCQKESRRLLRYCRSKSLGVAGVKGVSGGVKARGLAQATIEGIKVASGSTYISGEGIVIEGRPVD